MITPAQTESDRPKIKRATGKKIKAVKYSVFTPMLIKTVQEQQAEIELLKAEIEDLKANL